MNILKSPLLKRPLNKIIITSAIVLALSGAANATADTNSQVLVTVDNLTVTGKDLNEALRSSPFYTQFNAMNRDQQADLRGNILKRLVTSRLLSLEAKKTKLDESAEFIKEVDNFRKGLLYRHYMDALRNKIIIPDSKLAEMARQYQNNPDALGAAKSSYISRQYASLYKLTIQMLRDKYHATLDPTNVSATANPDTVVLTADGGIQITMGDIYQKDANPFDPVPGKDQLLEKIYPLAELLIVSKAAEDEDIDVSARVEGFKTERLPAMFFENQQDEWTKDENLLRAYYNDNPNASFIPQRWHIGMIVLKTEDEAKAILARIHNGESLFRLAGELSIDPYGRSRNGDLGWVRERSGSPDIENAIKDLDDGQISKIIKTPKGYHIVTILDRRPGGKRRYESMKDKIRQLVINDNMHNYLEDLQKKHKVTWTMLEAIPAKSSS